MEDPIIGQVVETVRGLTIGTLAGLADCIWPENGSAGASVLEAVRDNVAEAIEWAADELRGVSDWGQVLADPGTMHEIADGAPSCYTATLFQEVVDLGAFAEDISDLGPVRDLGHGAAVAVYMIAERLAWAIVADAEETYSNLTADTPAVAL